MKLSVIIPAYNEAATLEQCVSGVYGLNAGTDLEVIVSDDGSTDGTDALCRHFDYPGFKYIKALKNRGKGAAIRNALPLVTGDIVIIQDADLEYNPAEYKSLTAPIEQGLAEVVYGSRVLAAANPKSSWAFYLGGRGVSFWTNLLYGAGITDEPTCYKVFKAGILKSFNIESDGFEFCPEVTAKVLNRGIKIHEVPISYNPRSVEQGKKIRFKDGVIALWTLLKYRLTGRTS